MKKPVVPYMRPAWVMAKGRLRVPEPKNDLRSSRKASLVSIFTFTSTSPERPEPRPLPMLCRRCRDAPWQTLR